MTKIQTKRKWGLLSQEEPIGYSYLVMFISSAGSGVIGCSNLDGSCSKGYFLGHLKPTRKAHWPKKATCSQNKSVSGRFSHSSHDRYGCWLIGTRAADRLLLARFFSLNFPPLFGCWKPLQATLPVPQQLLHYQIPSQGYKRITWSGFWHQFLPLKKAWTRFCRISKRSL